MNQQFLKQLSQILLEEQIFCEEPMSKHTTFRIGGTADVLVQPRLDQISSVVALCKESGVPVTVIGNGSNLLVGDRGIRGVVIELGKPAEDVHIEGNLMDVAAGTILSKAASAAAYAGLTGMEFAAGIPGTMGGAVVMNAGAYGGEMKDVIQSVEVLTREGQRKTLTPEELELGYRHSCILKQGYIVLKARIRLKRGDQSAIRAKMEDLKERRVSKQPLNYPSAGSTFKRPEGYFAGKLIEDSGLRGYQVGGAQVSQKHCGFVVNVGDATAADVRKLLQDVQDKVQEQFQIQLEPEVKMIGEF